MQTQTFRDGRYEHIHQEAGMERWHDHGLGTTVNQIAQHCGDYQSQHVLAFTLVFNPNPELTAMMPLDQREQFVCELTETALERFFEARGVEGGLEYAFVMHHRESENPQSPGLHDPHTHVILPGTYYDEGAGERTPLYFSRNKHVNHVELLHQTTEQTLRELMDRYVGRDWEQRYDALEAVREQQRRIVETPSQGKGTDEQDRTWEMWLGARATDETHSAVGYYRAYPTDRKSRQTTFTSDKLTVEFRPLTRGLNYQQADKLSAWMRNYAHDHPGVGLNDFFGLAQAVDQMNVEERRQFFKEDMPTQEVAHEKPVEPPARSYDIDFF